MILYLHGFRSSPTSRKATMLRERLRALGREPEYICPALPASPRAAVDLARQLVGSVPPSSIALVGSSLGGYYATWLAERLGCRAVLLNPAITPARDLAAHLGRQPVYFTDEEIDFRPEYLAELRQIDTPVITCPDRYFLVAATGDALIDFRTMTDKYRGARQLVVEGSNHELSDFALYMDEVLDFCGIGEATGGRQ
ncbi:MAG: YqiA/YcfP family alpha/beta fold hydrolase [Burkholderiaceae bacterium]